MFSASVSTSSSFVDFATYVFTCNILKTHTVITEAIWFRMHIRHRLTCKLCEMNEALTWVKISIRLPNWTSDELCALYFLHLPPYLFFFLSFFFFPGHVVRYTQSSHFLLSTSFMCESYLNCSTNGGIFLARFCFLSLCLCLSDLVEIRPFECRSLKKL